MIKNKVIDEKIDVVPSDNVNSKDINIKTPTPEDHLVKKEGSDGSVLKQAKVAEVITGGFGGSSASGMGITAQGNNVSGNNDGVLGTSNGTPVGSNTRASSRYGKKIEKVANKLNSTPSEQYEKKYVESKTLAEDPTAVQGYNGTYLNETYKTQKNSGFTPAELTYDRSIDFIEKDEIYFAEGQQIGSTAKRAVYPTTEYDVNSDAYVDINDPQSRGNIMNTDFEFCFAEDGGLSRFKFNNVDISPVFKADTAKFHNANLDMFVNQNELDREQMETNAGDESNPDWCPLPKAIDEPNAFLALIHDYESTAGAEAFVAANKLKTALSFQLNRATKDGLDTHGPAIEALIGNIYRANGSTYYNAELADIGDNSRALDQIVTDVAYNNAGSAGSFIAAYDSPRKYSTKADLLLQPRSFKMHLMTGLSNMNPLMVNPKLVKAFEMNECFSTKDGSYDPTKPILMTDKCNIVHVTDWNKDFVFEEDSTGEIALNLGAAKSTWIPASAFKHTNTGESSQYVYYKASSCTLTKTAASKNVTVTETAATRGEAKVYIIIADAQINLTGYTEVEVEAGKWINFKVNGYIGTGIVAQGDIADDGYTYGYHDLRNKYYVKIKNFFVTGIYKFLLDNESQLKKAFGTNITKIPCIHSTRAISTWDLIVCAAMPYIINERISCMRDLLHYQNAYGYPFKDLVSVKDVKDAHFLNFTANTCDDPLNMGSLNPISLIKWEYPEFIWHAGDYSGNPRCVAPWYMSATNYKADGSGYLVRDDTNATICWPSTRAGIKLDGLTDLQNYGERQLRLDLDIITDITGFDDKTNYKLSYVGAYKYGKSTDGQLAFSMPNSYKMTIQQYLSLPRENGFVIDTIGGLTPKYDSYRLPDLNTKAIDKLSFRTYLYSAKLNADQSIPTDILSDSTINIDRAANFQQSYYMIPCISDIGMAVDNGVLLGVGYGFDGSKDVVAGKTLFTPFANGSDVKDSNVSLIGIHRVLYHKLQVLPFIINPYDAFNIYTGAISGFDIYDTMYLLGLCGFRDSDYTEDVYNRENTIFNLGYTFVQDPWTMDSCYNF